MTTQRQLTHLSLECIFPYMDPYKRFQLTQKLPTLQKVEKSVPVWFKSLAVGANFLSINDKTFEMRLIKVHENGKVEKFQHYPSKYLSEDVDRYGFEDLTVYIDPNTRAAVERRAKHDAEVWKGELEELSGWSDSEKSRWYRQRQAKLEENLEIYNFRENKLEPPFKFYLEFLEKSRKSMHTKVLEKLFYNKKIDIALSYFLAKLLGKRTVIIEDLVIKSSSLPLSFDQYPKLKVRELIIKPEMDYVLDALQLENPLNVLGLPDDFQDYEKD